MALLACVAAAVPACSSSDAAEEADGGDTFTAYNSNFQDFHSWSSFTFEGAAIPDSPHATAGARIEYVNQVPPQGATKFPVGTIIVKEMSAGAVPTRVTFAMVKVGGGFNPEGAVDWAWYELQNNADGSVTILWGPDAIAPAGDPYANSPVTCNQCHSNAAGNDYVQSLALNLARLESGAPFDGGVLDDAGPSGPSQVDAQGDGASE